MKYGDDEVDDMMHLKPHENLKYTSPNHLKAFGYKLGDDVYFFINERVLFNSSKTNLARLQLRTTMSSLLEFLLNNSHKDFISDDEIMANVWEANSLRASSHRLWQVMRELKIKLNEIGMSDEILYRSRRCGFIVNSNKVEPLYSKEAGCNDFYLQE